MNMNTQPAPKSFGKPELALMLVTLFWGATFLIVQLAVIISEIKLKWLGAAKALAVLSVVNKRQSKR